VGGTLDAARTAGRHVLSHADAQAFLSTSAWPHPTYHATTYTGTAAKIVRSGIDVARGVGQLGEGFYTAAVADTGYGGGLVTAAVRSERPFVIGSPISSIDRILGRSPALDPARWREGVIPAPHVSWHGFDELRSTMPLAADGTWDASLRRHLLDRGFDSIVMLPSRDHELWVIGLVQDGARVVDG
jgi:hypothetical protein